MARSNSAPAFRRPVASAGLRPWQVEAAGVPALAAGECGPAPAAPDRTRESATIASKFRTVPKAGNRTLPLNYKPIPMMHSKATSASSRAFAERYNPRNSMNETGKRIGAVLVLWLLLSLPALAADWSQPEQALASSIAGISGPGVISLQVRNASSIPNDQVSEIRRGLETDLTAAGIRVDPRNAAAEVRVTLSENVQGYIWVTEVKQGADTRIAMLPVTRLVPPSTVRQASSVSIRKAFVHLDETPILDALVLGAGTPSSLLVLLEPDNVSLLSRSGDRWALQQAVPLAHVRPWPRDVRGRLAPARDHLFDAYLPGMVCASGTAPPLSLQCHEGDDPWPIGPGQKAFFGASRNFFSGALSPGIGSQSNVDPFYAAAAVPRPNYNLWVMTGVDGRARLADGVNTVVSTSKWTRDWGSDIAAVSSRCGSNTQILASDAGDQSTFDSVRAFEVFDRDIVPVSEPVEFNGPVAAMWTQSDGGSVLVVVHNLTTGKYEAYSLTIACSQ